MNKNIFKFICCGSVDDGKSSLIGQLLLNASAAKQDVLDDALNASFDNGSNHLEPGLLLDGLLDERKQQITIDIAHRLFDYNNTRYHIYDCPGHEQYTKNMAIAAAEANCAILVVDILKGISSQTKKHLSICALFQIKYLIIALSKCDLTAKENELWDEKLIQQRKEEIEKLLKQYDFKYDIIPIDSIHNKNIDKILAKIEEYNWLYFENKKENTISHVYCSQFYNNKRYIYTKPLDKFDFKESEKLNLYPSNKTVTIKSNFNCGILEINEDIDIQKGDVLTNIKLLSNNKIKHCTYWFDTPTNEMLFRHGTIIANINNYTQTLIELDRNIHFNNINEIKENGFGIIIDKTSKKTLGISVFLANDNLFNEKQKGKIYWFSGLSGSGKTTHAKNLLNYFSIKPILLDADDVRKTVNSDLGYTKEDCTKNIERISQIAQLLSNQGFNVIVTCISKFKEQRKQIKERLKPNLIEILVNKSLESLKKNDSKGLYKTLGTENMIKDYEYGTSVDIILDTEKNTQEENFNYLIDELRKLGALQ